MRFELIDKAHKLLLISILLALAIFSNLAFSKFLAFQNLSTCTGLFLNFSCALPNFANFGPRFYTAIFASALVAMIIFRIIFIKNPIYPFLQLMITIIFTLSLFDLIFGYSVKNINQLYSSSYNVIDLVMIINFLILIVLGIFNKALILISVFLSFFAKFFSFLVLYVMLSYADGTLGLFLIFLTFSFGALTPHLMALCMAFQTERVDTKSI